MNECVGGVDGDGDGGCGAWGLGGELRLDVGIVD